MKLRGYIVIVIALAICATVTPQFRSQSQPPQQDRQRSFIDHKGGLAFPVKVGDSTVQVFVNNQIFHHNGAVITCDSVVRYSEQRLEGFGNVIINKDSTYIYGDRFYYDGNTNLARVYSPLVKMIDGETVMYTYNLIYNTKTNVGEFFGNGTVSKNGTLLESERGYYYGDTKDVICVRSVELRDSSYMIKSDSLGYNMDTEIATFLSKTYIWNDKGEILSADDGVYYTKEKRYNFYSDAYIMTDERELWADDIDYREEHEDAVLKSNIQIRDEKQEILAFGDYGLYFGERSEAMLTDNPSVISYDPERGDSLFLRADSLFLFMVDSMSIYHPSYKERMNAQKAAQEERQPGGRPREGIDRGIRPEDNTLKDTTVTRRDSLLAVTATDDLAGVADSLSVNNADIVAGEKSDSASYTATLTGDLNEIADSVSAGRIAGSGEMLSETGVSENKEIESGENNAEDIMPPPGEAVKEAADTIRNSYITIVPESEKDSLATSGSITLPDPKKDTAAVSTGAPPAISDSTGTSAATTPFPGDDPFRPMGEMEPSLREMVGKAFAEFKKGLEKIEADGLANEESGEEPDDEEKETPRVLVAYHNVKIYRSDFQAVCDSLVSFTMDSTIRMYIEPVMWNGDNQIKSDEVTIYTRNQELERAVFIAGAGGNPIMSARLDYKHFNQVTGKTIEAFFRDNDIYRTDANGNGISYYFMQDDSTKALQGFLVVECADISFYIENQTIEDIIFRTDPVYAIYPMTAIPASQPQKLPNFKWEGDRKPSQADVFSRKIRESRRENYSSMPTPQFSITDRINNHRRRITENGEWEDRTDDISREAHEFVETIRLREAKTLRRQQQ